MFKLIVLLKFSLSLEFEDPKLLEFMTAFVTVLNILKQQVMLSTSWLQKVDVSVQTLIHIVNRVYLNLLIQGSN